MIHRILILAFMATPIPVVGQSPQARVVLERTPCFGLCPAYRLELRADGAVTFEGLNRYAKKTAIKQVGPSAVDSLAAYLDRAGFFSLSDSYTPGLAGCRQHATDHPSFRLTLIRGGRTKTIEYYYGCLGDTIADSPDSVMNALHHQTGVRALLTQMAAAVDSVAGASAWLTRP